MWLEGAQSGVTSVEGVVLAIGGLRVWREERSSLVSTDGCAVLPSSVALTFSTGAGCGSCSCRDAHSRMDSNEAGSTANTSSGFGGSSSLRGVSGSSEKRSSGGMDELPLDESDPVLLW